MSEANYVDERIRDFMGSHPASDGWMVYTCHEDLRRRLFLNYLLDFLRDRKLPVLERSAANEVRSDDMVGTKDRSHAVEPGNEWDRGSELDGNNWLGTIKLDWNDQPVHYLTFTALGRMGTCIVTMVGTKSNHAMRDFHARLAEYGHGRVKTKKRRIIVVNGPDIEIPRVSWEDLVLPEGIAEDIRGNVESFFRGKDKYAELGIPYRRGFLLSGSPGCGKTMTIKALANTLEATFIAMHVRADLDDDSVSRAFEMAQQYAPSVLVIEDLDRMVRGDLVGMSHFLNMLDGLKAMEGTLVLATCNHPQKLDPALIHRPSRFDRVWRFTLPNRGQRLALLRRKGASRFSDGALTEVADRTNGFSMAYVQEVVVNALLTSAHEGADPTDETLFRSLQALSRQRKEASKFDEDLAERENLGFSTEQRHGGLVLENPVLVEQA